MQRPPAIPALREPDEPDLQSVMQLDLPHVEAAADVEAHREPNNRRRAGSRTSRNECRAFAALRLADRCDGRFVLGPDEFTKLIGPRDRRRRRPAMARHRAGFCARSARPHRSRRWRAARPGSGSSWTGRSTAATCRSNCRACRCSTAIAIFSAIGVLASAAMPHRPAAKWLRTAQEFTVSPSTPQPLSADIVQAGPAGDFGRRQI